MKAPALLALLLCTTPLAAQEMRARAARLDSILPTIMDSAQVPGLTLVAFENGKPVAWRTYGVRNSRTKEPVDTATVFEAMSLTKQVVAYIAMRLADRKLLDLERPAYLYLPHPDLDDPRAKQVTLAMLLSHSSGLPNWRPDGGKLAFRFDPGTRFGYSGEGYVWLGMVIEKVTGKPLAEVARTEVFTPLDMPNSSLAWDPRFAGNAAAPHVDSGPLPVRTSSEVNAAASLRTTGPDYGRFVAAILNAKGISRAARDRMFTPRIAVADSFYWGLGLGVEKPATGGRAVMQWGDNWGYKGFLLVDPDRGTGLVYFANSNSGMSVRNVVVETLMPGQHPALAWSRYEQFDAPVRQVRREITATLASAGTDSMIRQYRALRKVRPPEAFDEEMLNTIGYQLLRAGKNKDAIAVFQLNVESFPQASNPYDSLGEAYAADGQDALAIATYEKSIALDPSNANAVEIVKKLRDKQPGSSSQH